MAGGKETPRQKMIGMMYLVLTALLALNVSKEIVVAFITLNDKLDQSTAAIEYKNAVGYQDFENYYNVPQTRELVKTWRPKAQQIEKMANRVHDFYLDETNKLIKAVEGDAKEWVIQEEGGKRKLANLMDIGSKDDYDAATRLFVGDRNNIVEAGKALMTEMHVFRDSLCYIISTYESGKNNFTFSPKFDGASMSAEELNAALATANPKDTAKIKQLYGMLTLPATMKNHDEEVPWQAGMFDHAPVVAAAALFTSLRNDVRNAESVAIDHLLGKVNAPKFNFNKIEPLAFARTSYLNVGDSMNLSVMIAAYDSNEVAKIRFAVNDSNPANYKDHTGKISVQGSRAGAYTMYGLVSVKENGEEKWKPWKYMYEVGEPTGVIANEDLTVVYAGYEHTFSASVSGYPQDRVSLSLPGLAVSPKGGGKFSVKAPANLINKKVKAGITVKTDGGGSKSFAGPEFTVKPLPIPSSYLGNLSSVQSDVSLGDLKTNAQFLRVAYDPSVSLDPAKVKFTVMSFEMTATVGAASKSFPAKGGQLTPDMTNFIKMAKPGTVVAFNSIVAQGPAGQVRVPPMLFKVK
jgi:gliding motility-associated protein GldM